MPIWIVFYTGAASGTAPWQQKVAQTVASGIAAGILSGGSAVINHIAESLKAKGVDPSQLKGAGQGIGGNGAGGNNGGGGNAGGNNGGANNGGGKVVYIGGGNNGNNGGGKNGGNSGGGNNGNSAGGNNGGGNNAGNNGGGNNGGGNNQGFNSGGNGGNNGNNGGSNGGNSGGGNNGGNGNDNGNAGNNGGASKGNAGTSYVFQQAGNTGNAGSANSNGGNGGATSQGGGLSLVQGQVNNGAQGNNGGSSGSNKEDLGTTYVFNPIGANGKGGFNTVPTVSGTQRNVRKPANDLLFSSSGGNDNAGNNNQGNTYRFTPINGGMPQGRLFGAGGNGQLNMGHFQGNMGHNMHYDHGILTPPHVERPLLNVHEEGHHLRPVAAAENIGSVLNEIVSLLPHEDYNMHAGGDDIHVKPPSMSSSILTNHGHLATVHGGEVPHPATVHGGELPHPAIVHWGELPHGSRQNLVNELAEIHATGSTRSKKLKSKEKETMKAEKGSKIVSHKHGDDDFNVDDDDDDEFDIDKDKEDKDEKEADEVPSNDEKEAKEESEKGEKETKEESEKEEKEVANGKDLEEVFDELDDRDAAKEHAAQAKAHAVKEAKPEKTKQPPQAITSEAKVSFHGLNVNSDRTKVNSEVSKVGSPATQFVKGTKPGVKFQDFKSSSLGGVITARQKFLVGNTHKMKGKSWKMKKKSFTEKNKEHPSDSKWAPLPVEVKDAWPGTLVSKRSSLRNMNQTHDRKDTAVMGSDRSKLKQETKEETTATTSGGTEKRKLIQEQNVNGNAKFTLIENKAKIEGRKKIKDPKRPGLIRDYDEENTPTISSISTKEVVKTDFDVRNEISYDPEINNHEIAGIDENDETAEVDKRSKISDPSKNEEIKENENDFESAIDEDKEKRNHINQPVFMNEGTMKESPVDIPNLGDERGGIVADDLSQKILYRTNTVSGSKRDQLANSIELNDETIADDEDEQFENEMQNTKKSDILKSKIRPKVKSHGIKRHHKRKHKKRHRELSYRKKHDRFTTGAKRTLFDLRSNKKELANMAVKAFLPLLMNKIHHKLEGPANHGQQLLAYYPYDPKALQTAAATTTISTNRQQARRPASHSNPLKSGLTFALLSNLFKGQSANQGVQQQQPRVINRLSYPIYFIPPVRQENPPVYSIGPQPAFVPPANIQNPPVASIGPDPPFINSPAPVLPPVASIGPEPFFNPPQTAPKLPEVASIAKDPKPLPPKPGPKLPEVPSIAKEPKPLPTKALPVKPPPTLKKKKGKDKKGKARHITPARATPTQPASTRVVSTHATSEIAEPTRRFMPTQNQEHDPYNTESSMHHEHYHIHHGRYEHLHNLPEHHEEYMHDMHNDHHMHEVHGTQSSIHNTMSAGQGINHEHEHEHEEHDMHYGMHNDDNDLQGIESDDKMPQGESKSLLSTGQGQNHDLLTKKLSSLLPGFVLVPGHEKGIHDEAIDNGGRGDKKGVITGPGITRSVITKENFGGAEKRNAAKKRGRKKKNVDKKISIKREMINKDINNRKSRKINHSKEIARNKVEKGEKKSLNVNKITIANAAVKAVMPFLLKNIIQRRKVTKQRKVMYLPMTSGAVQGAAMQAGAAQAIAVPVSSAAAVMLPSVPAIGPDPVVAPPEPAKMLPSVASIGPEPDVAPPKPAKALPEVASIGKDPVAPQEEPKKEKKPNVVTDKEKKGKNDKGKDADKKEDKKESKDESKGKDKKKQDNENEKENKKTDDKGKTRHFAPKMVPLDFLNTSQKQKLNDEQTEKSSHKSRFVLVPHHEQERTDQAKQFMEHYDE